MLAHSQEIMQRHMHVIVSQHESGIVGLKPQLFNCSKDSVIGSRYSRPTASRSQTGTVFCSNIAGAIADPQNRAHYLDWRMANGPYSLPCKINLPIESQLTKLGLRRRWREATQLLHGTSDTAVKPLHTGPHCSHLSFMLAYRLTRSQ